MRLTLQTKRIAEVFELGSICWPKLLKAKAKYCIKQRDLRLSFKTDSGIKICICVLENIQHSFEINFNEISSIDPSIFVARGKLIYVNRIQTIVVA